MKRNPVAPGITLVVDAVVTIGAGLLAGRRLGAGKVAPAPAVLEAAAAGR